MIALILLSLCHAGRFSNLKYHWSSTPTVFNCQNSEVEDRILQ